MKRFAVILMCLVCFIFGACMPAIVSAEQNNPLKIWYQNNNGYADTWNLVDTNTGVNYVVVSVDSPRGMGISITPRLNADGSLYVTN